MTELSDLDLRLIEALVRDPLESHKKLAEALGISQASVARRIRSLVEDQVMKVTLQEEFEAVGFRFLAHLDVYVSQGYIDRVSDALCALDEVTSCVLTAGTPEVIVRVGARDQEHFANLLKRDVAAIRGIERVETLTVLRVDKYELQYGRIDA